VCVVPAACCSEGRMVVLRLCFKSSTIIARTRELRDRTRTCLRWKLPPAVPPRRHHRHNRRDPPPPPQRPPVPLRVAASTVCEGAETDRTFRACRTGTPVLVPGFQWGRCSDALCFLALPPLPGLHLRPPRQCSGMTHFLSRVVKRLALLPPIGGRRVRYGWIGRRCVRYGWIGGRV
jgi:hypothetical protein